MTRNEDCLKYYFKDEKNLPETFHEYPGHDKEDCPLVIDNGSYQFRTGWASSTEPSLIFKNVIARNRGNKKDREWDLLVGNDIPDLEAVRWMIRTAFDFNVVVNFSIQESIFDHAFSHLGINTDGELCHPIVMTEPVANPSYSRKQMSELLFEAYNIPKIAYGIDSLFSFHYNKIPLKLGDDALIVASGFQSTHVMPVIDGRFDLKHCKRVDLGGYNNGAYLQRLLQLKYPKLSSAFTLTRMDQFLRDEGRVAIDYMDEITPWGEKKFKDKNSMWMQIPEKPNTSSTQSSNPPSEEAIALGRKLRRMECKLYDLECIAELEHENPDVLPKILSDAGYSDIDEMNKKINALQNKIEKAHEEITAMSQNIRTPTEVPLRVEKHQALEILFQPTLVGYEQAGVGEVLEIVLNQYTQEQSDEMAKNVLITGGNTQYQGFKERVEADLIKCRPFGSEYRVQMARNPSGDPWNGARQWAIDNMENTNVWMSKEEFVENGWEYLKEHSASNYSLHPMSNENS